MSVTSAEVRTPTSDSRMPTDTSPTGWPEASRIGARELADLPRLPGSKPRRQVTQVRWREAGDFFAVLDSEDQTELARLLGLLSGRD